MNSVPEPWFQPNFLNIEYFFSELARLIDQARFLLTGSGEEPASYSPFVQYAFVGYSLLELFGALLSIFFITVIIYAIIRIREVQHDEHARLAQRVRQVRAEQEQQGVHGHERQWRRITALADSGSEEDWKIAIMEADAMLDTVLEQEGFTGSSLGERLQGAQLGDFLTLNQAWEAHKFRNMIAHNTNAPLTKREVQRIITLYQRVFEEFEVI